MTWSQAPLMFAKSDSEISVPIEISAASLMVCSSSSGRMVASEVEEAFVRKPNRIRSALAGTRRFSRKHTNRTYDLRVRDAIG